MLKRFVKNVLKGAFKSLPGVGLVESIKKEAVRDVISEAKKKNVYPNEFRETVKLIMDILDNGTIDDSVDERGLDLVIQILSGLCVLVSGLYGLIKLVS